MQVIMYVFDIDVRTNLVGVSTTISIGRPQANQRKQDLRFVLGCILVVRTRHVPQPTLVRREGSVIPHVHEDTARVSHAGFYLVEGFQSRDEREKKKKKTNLWLRSR